MKQALLFTDDDYHGQGGLFPEEADDTPLFAQQAEDESQTDDAPQADDESGGACDCKACKGTKLEVVCERTGAHPDCPTDRLGNRCTLEGEPARIIGRSFHYATIEPLDPDAEPIRCCWDIVADVMENGDGAFVREDDDTDE